VGGSNVVPLVPLGKTETFAGEHAPY